MPVATRRSLLALLAAGAGGSLVAGCARLSDPVVHGSSANTPPPVPSPDPAQVRAADEIAALGMLRAAVAAPAAQPWADGVAAMLAAHLAVVTARDPLGGRATPQPWFSPAPTPPSSPTEAAYQDAATALAQAHVRRAAEATAPSQAMLWASMSVATSLQVGPGPVPVLGPVPHEVATSEQAGARNVVLAHLHALAQLLEIGIGITNDDAREVYQTRLGQVRTQVVAQQEAIRGLGADPVGPLPGYDLPGPVDTATNVAATWTLVEGQVFTACAPVIAASPSADRAQAIADMVVQGKAVAARGAGTTFFPGWV